MSIIDYSGRSQSEEIIRRRWNEFRTLLAKGVFSYNELDAAKANATFFKVFDDLFSNCHKFFDVSMENILSCPTTLMRAGRLNPTDPDPTYSRFIPDKNYIKGHNRFSPPGVEWLYLAIGDSRVAINCALKECRAAKGEMFGLCQFKLNEGYSDKMLVDLTIANDISFEELNAQFEKAAAKVCAREVTKALNSNKRNGRNQAIDITDFEEDIKKWAVYTYGKLLSNEIFVPVETEDKELMYSPFQCIAQYFLSIGYEGIVYSSTVYEKGKNVVLFNKDAASPVGSIKTITI